MTILQNIRRSKPRTIDEFRKIGRMRFLNAGVFRETYRLKKHFVVKFPIEKYGKAHSATEIRRLRKLRRFPYLRRHLPKIFWYDKKSGIVVMKYYPRFKYYSAKVDMMGVMIQRLIYAASKIRCSDIHGENIHVGRAGEAVVIDLGY